MLAQVYFASIFMGEMAVELCAKWAPKHQWRVAKFFVNKKVGEKSKRHTKPKQTKSMKKESQLSLIDEKKFRNEEYSISPVTIEKVDKDFVLTYLINEIPSSNTFLIFNKSVIVNTSNQIQNAHVTYRGASYNSSYIGIVLKLHSLYIPYINEVNKLNENLTTEFKFQQNLYNIMNDVKSGKDSPYAIHYSVLYNNGMPHGHH